MQESLRERMPLQKRKILKKSIGGTIGVLFVCGFISIVVLTFFWFGLEDFEELAEKIPAFVGALAHVLIVVWFVFVALLLAWNPFYQWLYFRSYYYGADEDNIIIRKGVVAKKEITLPFSKITDVYVDQDPLDAVFRIYDVHISTPTESSGQFAHIDGVDKAGSVALRALLLERINAADRRAP